MSSTMVWLRILLLHGWFLLCCGHAELTDRSTKEDHQRAERRSWSRVRLVDVNDRADRPDLLRDGRRQLQGTLYSRCQKVAKDLRDENSRNTLTLGADRVSQIQNVLELISLTNADNDAAYQQQLTQVRDSFDRVDLFSDANDQAFVARQSNVCYAVFAGTNMWNIDDQMQNLDPTVSQVQGTNCRVRTGFHQAYYADYYDEFQRLVGACLRSLDGLPSLVLGGFSQGGAAAVTGAIDWEEVDPIVITFGAPRTVYGDCSRLDSSRHYRFVATGSSGVYDFITMGFNVYRHVGHALFLDDEDVAASQHRDNKNPPILYTGLDDNAGREPTSLNFHPSALYRDRFTALLGGDCIPIPCGKWDEGHWCNYDDECRSNQCLEGTCARREDTTLTTGGTCQSNEDCRSENCDYTAQCWEFWSWGKACQ